MKLIFFKKNVQLFMMARYGYRHTVTPYRILVFPPLQLLTVVKKRSTI